jgi:hypothetical protein
MKAFTKLSVITILFLIQLTFAFSYASLRINDPRKSWGSYPGTIEDMQMSIKPHGAYFEIGLFLKISPIGSIFKSEKDTLEAVLDLEMNQQSFINDSWLFINDSVFIRARLLDKYTAGFIYEGIVKRRKDPSIIYKNYQGGYQIRIFPMIGNSSRTVKINFFVPAVTSMWTAYNTAVSLPLDILSASYKKPENIKVFVYDDANFLNPAFTDNPDAKFTKVNHPVFGVVKQAIIPTKSIVSNYLYFNHKFGNGVFANIQKTSSGNYYQVILNPSIFNSIAKPKKVAFLVDYDESNSNVKKADLIKALKETIYKNLLPSDSFNIFLANDNILRIGKTWLAVDTSRVEYYFSNITENKIGSVSNLENLLLSGVDWVNKNSDSAEIILVANTAMSGNADFFNTIINNVLGLVTNHSKISVITYLYYHKITNMIGSKSYIGNNYLYTTLAAKTKGIFYETSGYYSSSLSSALISVMTNVIGNYENINAHISFRNGFTYDKASINGSNIGSFYSGKSYWEFGKFEGEPPIEIELSGYFRKVPFFKKFEIAKPFSDANYDTKTLWAANHLMNLENLYNKTSVVIYDIIQKSLDYRILSFYTAFLATEDDELDTIGLYNEDKDNGGGGGSGDIPVELVYFDGKTREGGIDLSWATASEINNYGFSIDRRILNETKWNDIKFIEGKGTSNVVNYYNYFDADVVPNTTYQYRLRQTDLDGTVNNVAPDITLKNEVIVTVKYDAEYNLNLEQCYPNPMSDRTKIVFTLPVAMPVKLEITDITGKIVATLANGELKSGFNEFYWDGKNSAYENLVNGSYFCILTAGTDTRMIKITINR